MTMKERLARAICDSYGEQNHWKEWLPEVNAVLDVLEKPDDEFIETLLREWFASSGPSPEDLREAFIAAIKSIREDEE